MKQAFGYTTKGEEIHLYTFQNKNGMSFSVTDYGCHLQSVMVPDKNGDLKDVVLGYESGEEYDTQDGCLGAIIGRCANRISGAQCVIDGVTYELEKNNGENNIHSGANGFQTLVWDVETMTEDKITFVHHSPDGDQGFPGNMVARVTYSITDEDELIINYDITSDKTTICNFTNHAYYNLDGQETGNMEHQRLKIYATCFTPSGKDAIPTGEIANVKGTPFDFTEMKEIGQDIDADNEYINNAGGYDHNYVIDGAEPGVRELRIAAKAVGAKSNIAMEIYTDLPGVQLYTGNFIGKRAGKKGAMYDDRHGFCLETQFYPSAINIDNFESPLVSPEKPLHSKTVMKFYVEE